MPGSLPVICEEPNGNDIKEIFTVSTKKIGQSKLFCVFFYEAEADCGCSEADDAYFQGYHFSKLNPHVYSCHPFGPNEFLFLQLNKCFTGSVLFYYAHNAHALLQAGCVRQHPTKTVHVKNYGQQNYFCFCWHQKAMSANSNRLRSWCQRYSLIQRQHGPSLLDF